jgi:hypothetical protein
MKIKEISYKELNEDNLDERVIILDKEIEDIRDFSEWQKRISKMVIMSRHSGLKLTPSLIIEKKELKKKERKPNKK